MTTIIINSTVQNLLSDCQSASEFHTIMVENYPTFFRDEMSTNTVVSLLSTQFDKKFANWSEASVFFELLPIASSEAKSEAKSEDAKETETTDENKPTNEDANSEQADDEKQLTDRQIINNMTAEAKKRYAAEKCPLFAAKQRGEKVTIVSTASEMYKFGFSFAEIVSLGVSTSVSSVQKMLSEAGLYTRNVRATSENTGEAKGSKPKKAKKDIEDMIMTCIEPKTNEDRLVCCENEIRNTFIYFCESVIDFGQKMQKLINEQKELKEIIEAEKKETAKKVLSNFVASGVDIATMQKMLADMVAAQAAAV